MHPVKLGIIGTGMAWERLHLPAIRQLGDRYQVVALADVVLPRAKKCADDLQIEHAHVYEDYHDLLIQEEVDAVVVAVPIPLNYSVTEDVITAGINVIAEKPLAPNMKEAKRFYELAKETNVQILIAENYRYNEEHAKIKYLIEEKKIGDVVYFIKNNVSDFPEEMKQDTFAAKEWRQYPEYEGGAFLDAALHDLAGLAHVFGKIEKVQAFGKPQQQEFNPYMSVNVNMQFKNGVIGQFVYWPSGQESQKPPIGWRIFGTQGMIYLEEKGCGMINVFMNGGGHEIINYEPEKGYYNEFLNFYNALQGTEQVYVTPEVEFEDVDVVFSCLRSIKKDTVERV